MPEFLPQTGCCVDVGKGCAEMSIGCRLNRHTGVTIKTEGDTVVQYCLLMHYQEGGDIGLTEEDMAPARAAFTEYADALERALHRWPVEGLPAHPEGWVLTVG